MQKSHFTNNNTTRHPDKVKESSQKYCTNNREKLRLKAKENYSKEERKAQQNKWKKDNIERVRLQQRKYQLKNLDKAKFRCAKRRAKKLQATPKWADMDKISLLYLNCPKSYQVDHIVPLQGKLVCGLHVENNLQYLTKPENSSKGNKFEPEFIIKEVI